MNQKQHSTTNVPQEGKLFSNPGTLRDMSTAALNSGQPYQRPVRERDIKRLMKEWDPACQTPIIVSYRDGIYNVVDGQHRISVLRRMNGGKNVTIPCLIFTGWTYEQEAAMYYKLDKASSHLKLAYATRALLESGTAPKIADIKQRIEQAGFTWALDKPSGVSYEIKPVGAVTHAYDILGPQTFSRMLGLLAGTWHGAQNSLTAGMISGVALFLKTHENELEDYEFIRRLSEVDPVEIIQLAQVEKPALRYAHLIRMKYNEQGAKILPDRFKK